MKATPIPIDWHPGLPIFASESFLKAVGDDYGWLGGFDDKGKLHCILPFTIINKAIFRMVRFRVETIQIGQDFSIDEEKAFLNSAMRYLRSKGADMIIPATTNTIFRTYPDGADTAPYGSYIIDLTKPEDDIWRNIDRIMRQNIKTAIKNGVTIRDGSDDLEAAHRLIVETFQRSKLPFMGYEEFVKFVRGLGNNSKILIADCNGVPQSYAVFGFSNYCAYAIYAGNIDNQQQGANKLLYWEAIRLFKGLGVQRYDFVGARINPEKGSKQESINALKKRFGANLKQGYIWKYSIKPLKYKLYNIAAQWRSGGDIVDAERHKMKDIIAVEIVPQNPEKEK
jgi:hypothetical protein